MPAKRNTNAPKGSARTSLPQADGVANDLIGIGIIVVAVAMIFSLVMPSSAIVTHAMAEGLRLGFGEGALLVPIALLLFAITMFLPTDSALVGRVALGLSLVVLAVLSMLSLMAAGSEEVPEQVLDATLAASTGGYVGAGIAWLMLTFVGRAVGMVLLVGLAVAGIVVCGFSVSNLVMRIQESMGVAAEHLSRARERVQSSRRRERFDDAWDGADDAWDEGGAFDEGAFAATDEPGLEGAGAGGVRPTRGASSADAPTSFIGARKTSVLHRRNSKPSGIDHATATMPIEGVDEPTAPQGAAMEPATKILRRKKPAKRAVAPAGSVVTDAAGDEAADAPKPTPLDELPFDLAPEGAAGVAGMAAVLAAASGKKPARGKAKVGSPEAEPGADDTIPEFLRNAAAAKGSGKGKGGRAGTTKATAGVGAGEHVAQPSAPQEPVRPGDASEDFVLPPLELLSSNPNSASSASSDSELERTARRLQSTLEEFGLKSRVSGWTAGPLVTTFKIEMGEGERVNKITNLQDDIQLSLASESVRIFAPIPGTSLVGIEIPNKRRQNVCLGDVMPYAQGGPLEFAIGRDSEGSPVVADLARMPHMLVAGTTGSGKSVLINAIIMSLIMRTTPEQVRLILVDPKRVEFSCYAGLPHLYVPVVTEPRQAASALQWAVTEMDRRLKVFERAGARDVKVYNKMVTDGKFDDMENPPSPMPYLVIVIDELSDLMMVAGKDVEASIVRIAQLARAAGIHLVLATQRPSADVVTGLIKSNVDTRVALKVSSSIDSRVILDQTGAERLMGRGDMLFRKSGGVLTRVLGAYASDEEIEAVVTFIRDQREPDYHDEILSAVAPAQTGSATAETMEEDDPLVWEAAQVVVDSQLGSTSGLQRRLKVGYARAGRIMDNLEQKGVVGPPDGSKPREVLLDAEGLEELRAAEQAYREV